MKALRLTTLLLLITTSLSAQMGEMAAQAVERAPGEQAREPQAPVQAADTWSTDMQELREIAVRHRVPMPPKEARLVLAHTESWSVLGNHSTSRDPGIYSPAFLLEEKSDGSVVILRGMDRVSLSKLGRGEPLWRSFSVEHVEPKLGGYAVEFSDLSAFVCAVQLATRRDERYAEQIWRRFRNDGGLDHWDVADGGERFRKPPLLLGRCIFDHLAEGLGQDQADWREIHSRMGTLFTEFPALKDAERSALFDDLKATVNAPPPMPNSVEALLLDYARMPSSTRHLGLFHEGEQNEAAAPARQIVLRGLDAVPELILLLRDRRVTSHVAPRFMSGSPRIERLGEIAAFLLERITGTDDPIEGTAANVVKFRVWLGDKRRQGEAAYLAEAIFRREGARITWVNETPAWILAHKYPEKLPAACDEFSKDATKEAQPFALAKALATSRLPKELRIATLSDFARRGSLEHRRCVLQILASLDARRCAEILDPLLEEIPADTTGPYWTSPEPGFSHVVMLIEDDGIWRDYLRVARRGSVGLRMEMMEPMSYGYNGGKNRERRLAFLAAFLDDETVRDMANAPEKYEGPCAAFTIPRIEVRDFAAQHIASILGFDDAPDEFWTPAEWRGLREKVRAGLSRERLPNLASK